MISVATSPLVEYILDLVSVMSRSGAKMGPTNIMERFEISIHRYGRDNFSKKVFVEDDNLEN